MRRIIILLEVQDKKIMLWVDSELIKSWNRRCTGVAGAPLEYGRVLEQAFSVVGVPCELELGDGFEDLRDL